ncbi:hypothetical protein E3N88_01396 [Mikania micrantha]|uniref:Uncharacterized protein n=1 Tax=Mikania micrantha TaxID=192012 RepID=A0A5N6Q3K0_9ASTR|nr:hypothetical protein E3N88_01396 [Mikania micrantha]
MSRRSDLSSVRSWEVPVLYALMTGSPPISLQYLIMMNVLEAREAMGKRYIPHVRLTTALLKQHNIRVWDYPNTAKDMGPLRASGLKKMNLVLIRTDWYLTIRHDLTREQWRVLQPGEQPLQEGEEEEEMGKPEHGLGQAGSEPSGFMHLPPPHMHIMPDIPQYSYTGHAYPFGVEEQGRRDRRSIYDRMEHWNRIGARNVQYEINANCRKRENERKYDQWRSGQPMVEHSPPLDYANLAPFDTVTNYHPPPSSHHSMWVDPYEQYRKEYKMTHSEER